MQAHVLNPPIALSEHACYYERMFPTRSLDQNAAPSIAGIVREETGDGRLIVQFLVDAAQGKVPGARPCHRRKARDKTRTFVGHFGDIFARARYGGRDVTVSPAGASQVCDVPKCPQMSQKIRGVTFCRPCPEPVEGACPDPVLSLSKGPAEGAYTFWNLVTRCASPISVT